MIASISKRFVLFGGLLFLPGSVFAANHGTIIYGPGGPTNIPTLSGWMLILLGLLLAAVAYRVLRDRKAGYNALVALLGVSALLAAGSGIKLVDEARATISIPLDNPNGGSEIIAGDGYNVYENTSGIPQIIGLVQLPPICPFFPSGNSSSPQECAAGLMMQPDDFCQIDCTDYEQE